MKPEVTPGGRALKFYSSVRIDVRKSEILKCGTDTIGVKTKVKVVKNKVAPPFQEAIFDIIYGKGISTSGEIIDLAVKHQIINKNGSWFSYKEQRIGQGKEAVKEYLKENSSVLQEIQNTLKKLKEDN